MDQHRQHIFQDFILDVSHLKEGHHTFNGTLGALAWIDICERAESRPTGCLPEVDITFICAKSVVEVRATIKFKIERVCIRTLKSFILKDFLCIEEKLYFNEQDAGDIGFVLKDGRLDVADFLSQHMILAFDAYPIHPDTLELERGAYGLCDGLTDRNHPFNVLKSLHSLSNSTKTTPQVSVKPKSKRARPNQKRLKVVGE